MFMKKLFTHFGFILLLAIFILPKDLKAENGQMMFVAVMSTFNEVPPVLGDGLGLVTVLFSEDRKEMFIHGAFTNLSGPVVSCHIHLGATDTTGPVVIDLSTLISGNRIKGAVPTQDGTLLFSYAAAGLLYVNAHTAANPAGEVRGGLVWMSEIIFPVVARGSFEVPPVTPNAFGFGALRFSQNLTRMEYQFMPIGLTGPVVAAHIHRGASGVNGPVIAGLNIGEFITGTIEDDALVEDIFFESVVGSAYINVHTTANPGGEIRGQILLDNPNNGTAVINGDQENPPVTTTAKGYGFASIDFPNLDTVTYLVVYSGITPTSAHIHRGAVGLNGPVIAPLVPVANLPGVYSGRVAINDQNLTSFFKDDLYFNIHSTTNPGGEIRGQIVNNLLKSFAFDVCGDQEVPAKNINGYGASFVALNKSNTEIITGTIVDGLSGDATAAHIHDGVFGSNGPVLFGLTTPDPLSIDVIDIPVGAGGKINVDGAYVNVHTLANPGGEVRGQVRRSLSCDINVGTVESAIQDLTLTSNLVRDMLILNANSDRNAIATVYVSDLTGKQLLRWPNSTFLPGSNKILYDVDQLSSGFYLLHVVDENNSVRSLKFIKQ